LNRWLQPAVFRIEFPKEPAVITRRASRWNELVSKLSGRKGTVPFFSQGTEKSGRSPTVLKPTLAIACLTIALAMPGSLLAEDAKPEGAPKKAARILMVTQSAGFKHGSVTRKNDALSPAERAMTDLGIASGMFRVDLTQDVAKDVTNEKLDGY